MRISTVYELGGENFPGADELTAKVELFEKNREFIALPYIEKEIDVPLEDLFQMHDEIIFQSGALCGDEQGMGDRCVPEGNFPGGLLDFLAGAIGFAGALKYELFEGSGRVGEAEKISILVRYEGQLVAGVHPVQAFRQRATGKYPLQFPGRKVLFLEDRGQVFAR